MTQRIVGIFGLAFVVLAAICDMAFADSLDGAYRGMIVCEKLRNSQFILLAPLDIKISGKTALAARPIFNLKGDRVVSSEIATGTLGEDGTLKLDSTWSGGQSKFQGNYGGTITEKGGTLTGTQIWTTQQGSETRSCTVAVVHARS